MSSAPEHTAPASAPTEAPIEQVAAPDREAAIEADV
jgi:hypothetical protein